MSYREHAPARALAPLAACALGAQRRRRRAGPRRARRLHRHRLDRGRRAAGRRREHDGVPRGVPAGVRVAGVRMRPGAGAALLGVDAAALRDARVALGDVWGDDGRGSRGARGAEPGPARRAAAGAGRARAADPRRPIRSSARPCARLHDPRARVEALARELEVSARQLRRRFEAAVGYGPKRLARVLRLERALAAARAGEELALGRGGRGLRRPGALRARLPRPRRRRAVGAGALSGARGRFLQDSRRPARHPHGMQRAADDPEHRSRRRAQARAPGHRDRRRPARPRPRGALRAPLRARRPAPRPVPARHVRGGRRLRRRRAAAAVVGVQPRTQGAAHA